MGAQKPENRKSEIDSILSEARVFPPLPEFSNFEGSDSFPLLILVDDRDFASRNLNNLLWVTFTRSNPAADIHGIGESVRNKHWGCEGPLIIDARIKPHHAPPLVEDAAVSKRVDALATAGGPLFGLI